MDPESAEMWSGFARALVARDRELRAVLVKLNPVTDRRWDVLFRALVDVTDDIRTLRGQVRR